MAEVIVESAERLQQRVIAGKHEWIVDEPVSAGGDDYGPDPYALLLGALGTCISITLRLYAARKHWDLQRVRVTLRHQKIHAQDCADCETREGQLDLVERRIELTGNLQPDQIERLREIARRCPVHRTLTSEIKIVDLL